MPFYDLRQFIGYLEEKGDLLRVREEVDIKYEIAAYIRKTSDTQGPALLFEHVRGFDIPVVGGIYATRRRAFWALECSQEEVTEKFIRSSEKLVPVVLVSRGPCQETVFTGTEVDLTRLPVPIFSDRDSGAFITCGVVISRDPETGDKNASIYRMELKGPRRLGVLSNVKQHLGLHISRAEALNQPLEIAVAIGCDPIIPLATQWRAPLGVDELTIAGALRGAPVEVTRCKTVDLEVPATAEIVIEGRILPGVRDMEGPFGEYTGYYTPGYPKPVIEVTAMTHRRNPMYQAALTGMPTTENHILKQIPLEVSYYSQLKKVFPGVKAVHLPGEGLWAVISMKQHSKYEARSVITTMLGLGVRKLAVVVDEDIDIYNTEQVLWAITTRSQPHEDVIILPNLSDSTLDPSQKERGVSSGMGIDATRPFGESFPETVIIPGVENVPELTPRRPA